MGTVGCVGPCCWAFTLVSALALACNLTLAAAFVLAFDLAAIFVCTFEFTTLADSEADSVFAAASEFAFVSAAVFASEFTPDCASVCGLESLESLSCAGGSSPIAPSSSSSGCRFLPVSAF